MTHKIWLSSPHMGGTEQKFVNEAFDTNWVAPLGPNVNGLESDIESYIGENKKVTALSSGTSAIHLALIMSNVIAGDEVLCQSFTFSASANPILYQGATPVFIDSEFDTWNMCPLALEEAIIDRIKLGKKPKAIIVVHLYGMPAQMDKIADIANKYNIKVIEDAAEALGSTINGRACGTFGDFGIFSFNGNKIITTSGGGALVCNTFEAKQKAAFYATQSRDDAAHYEHSYIGYNYRMSNICAGIGRGQMEVLNQRVKQRRGNYDFYFNNLDKNKFTFLNEPASYFANRWLSTVLVSESNNFNREDVRLALEKENIEARPLWKPMHLQPIFEKYPYYGNKVSETLFDIGLCLPSGSNLTKKDLNRVLKVINSI
ncbi:DegT/DnrJ/EryC1/StrS family aminotransferase [uncultured Polaribacter sp.]|uniref:DegT/DnrJ/EryC1/StrS family aminotransferase n=1 Tax=uncultured Polaribacter sp. TaxID=174711 RepID=UPI0026040861|nr:DegT/DnrJ/EryC1/StrS family aminotransferase [uncultured Polaribacter sp.]